MNIQETIERALSAAGLNTQSGPMRGVTDTIRKALASAGLVAGGAVAPAQATPPGGEPIDVVARELKTGDAAPQAEAAEGQFLLRSFSAPAGSRDYRLYIPAARAGQTPAGGMPLVVMLHGCTQSAQDIAAGTQMNRLAEQHGLLVVYPEQPADANPSRCWNWFRSQDQVRQGGEPEVIAGIVRAVMAEQPVDPRRVYVAGLSAGAAMAVILGETYPDLFSAVGAHSGLPYAAAHDIPSAMAAMKGRSVMGRAHLPGTADDPRRPASQAVPLIVFHGDRDHTVQHSNGENIARQAIEAHTRVTALTGRSEQGQAAGGRAYTRTVHSDASDRPRVEVWTLHGAGHAWSGGDPAGTYTDSNGPSASVEMLRFFLAQAQP